MVITESTALTLPIKDTLTLCVLFALVVTLIVGMLFKSIIKPLGALWIGYKASKQILLTAKV